MTADRARATVRAEDVGLRLDQFLAARIEGLSRRKARVLIDIGGVFIDRARVKVAGRKVREGQTIEVVMGGALERATKKVGKAARDRDDAALPAYRIIYEDEHIVVVDKPAGLLTAPTPESDRGNLADLLSRHPGGARVFVVHRLDLETSGVLIFAKTSAANRVLSDAFRNHDVQREYIAVVAGAWPETTTRVDAPIDGRPATSLFRVVERLGEQATVLEVRLETGRTHQIRIHTAEEGHPVLGDRAYGRPSAAAAPRMALHARTLGLAHPISGDARRWESPLPEALESWLESLRAQSQ